MLWSAASPVSRAFTSYSRFSVCTLRWAEIAADKKGQHEFQTALRRIEIDKEDTEARLAKNEAYLKAFDEKIAPFERKYVSRSQCGPVLARPGTHRRALPMLHALFFFSGMRSCLLASAICTTTPRLSTERAFRC